jgi:hypothetical protein
VSGLTSRSRAVRLTHRARRGGAVCVSSRRCERVGSDDDVRRRAFSRRVGVVRASSTHAGILEHSGARAHGRDARPSLTMRVVRRPTLVAHATSRIATSHERARALLVPASRAPLHSRKLSIKSNCYTRVGAFGCVATGRRVSRGLSPAVTPDAPARTLRAASCRGEIFQRSPDPKPILHGSELASARVG